MDEFENQVFLLAEDGETDAPLIEEAFRRTALTNPFRVVPSGQKAMEYLKGAGRYADRDQFPIPSILLMDVKMPGRGGFEVLQWIRTQPALAGLVVVILTSSNRATDADRASELGAKFYLTKPAGFEELVEMVRCLHGWLRSNQFPLIHRD